MLNLCVLCYRLIVSLQSVCVESPPTPTVSHINMLRVNVTENYIWAAIGSSEPTAPKQTWRHPPVGKGCQRCMWSDLVQLWICGWCEDSSLQRDCSAKCRGNKDAVSVWAARLKLTAAAVDCAWCGQAAGVSAHTSAALSRSRYVTPSPKQLWLWIWKRGRQGER